MKTTNNEVFLNKFLQRIKNGDFDQHFTIPFMTKELLFYSVKDKINNKIKTGGTPILNENEINDCIEQVKETALNIIMCYIKEGFLIRTEAGLEFTPKGKKIIGVANRM
jgi:hypothetical protein